MIPDEWLVTGVDPKGLSEHTLRHDRWDEQDLFKVLTNITPYRTAREKITDIAPTGQPAMEDVFFGLLKAAPRLQPPDAVKPSHLVNLSVMEQFMSLDQVGRLRHWSVGDDVQAGLSAATMEPQVEVLFDKLSQQQQQAESLERTLGALALASTDQQAAQQDLDALAERIAAEGGDDSEGGGGSEPTDLDHEALDALAKAQREAGERVQQLQDKARTQADEFEGAMDSVSTLVQMQLSEALEQAITEAQGLTDTALAWGMEPGELQRLPAKERMELAKRLNDSRLRRIAEMFGPMQNIRLSEQTRNTKDAHETIVDIELGRDLPRILSSEAAMLADEDMEWNFYRRFAEGNLMQYRMEGTETLGRGGIIYCLDGSGSMSGQREMAGKAVMLSLLHLARQQKRTMHIIHFGSVNEIFHIEFTKPEHFQLDRILDAAELFLGGGTNFSTPMTRAREILHSEFDANGFTRADVVFCTDDECYVDSEFMEDYLESMHRMQATTWGIAVGYAPNPQGALYQMCEDKVIHVSDLFDQRDGLRPLFRGVT
jgi:uncharacterized protein with von Willebrand factor type A (vWA) domain